MNVRLKSGSRFTPSRAGNGSAPKEPRARATSQEALSPISEKGSEYRSEQLIPRHVNWGPETRDARIISRKRGGVIRVNKEATAGDWLWEFLLLMLSAERAMDPESG